MNTACKKLSLSILAILLFSNLTRQTRAEILPGSLFVDHAVLQRDVPLNVWGTGDAGEKVTVTVGTASATTYAGADGAWLAILPALPAGGPYDMTFEGTNRIVRKDVLIGEVWLCAGASNMEFTVTASLTGPADAAKATHPQMRLFDTPVQYSASPKNYCQGSWITATPESAATFSAVAYYFGHELMNTLNVPVGLILAATGETYAEQWMNRETLAANHLAHEKAFKGVRGGGDSTLFNAMVMPLAPYTLQGIIWYQGEKNVHLKREKDSNYTTDYLTLLPLLISDWRKSFSRNDLPFFIVQLANYKDKPGDEPETKPWPDSQLGLVREAQAIVAANDAHSGLAVTIDLGTPGSAVFKEKAPIGKRLALIALAKNYGQQVEYSGPVFRTMSVDGNSAILTFDHADNGLEIKGASLTGFKLCGEDGLFYPAKGEIAGNTVKLTASQVSKPTCVSYGWESSPICNLYNKSGLPATPFRYPVPARDKH